MVNTGTALLPPVPGSVWIHIMPALLGFTVTVTFGLYLLSVPSVDRLTGVPPARDAESAVNVAILDVFAAMVPRI